ncbi:MAG: S28 family serine protease [Flavobacteriales bacterium]
MNHLKHFVFLLIITLAVACKSKQEAVTDVPPPPPNADKEQVDAEMKVLFQRLNSTTGISAKQINNQNSTFKFMLELQIEQPVDHFNPKSEKFNQKVYLSHRDFNSPMVLYLNGYTAGNNTYVTEATGILEANQLHVEHRFFSDSKPEGDIPWEFLTIEQAANDHHRVVELLKEIYPRPWVSTGISKGGMVTIFHKKFFPEDVAVAMPYVAPMNIERHDSRIYEHLNTVGTDECRAQIIEFQNSLLEDYDASLKLFKDFSNKASYIYPLSHEASFELSVLEYSFAFWQWSGDCSTIPGPETSLKDKMSYLFYQIDAPSFFNSATMTGILPYFYQGYREIGMYGYEVEPFKENLRVYTEEVDNQKTFIPEDIEVTYNAQPVKDILSWLDENGNNMIYIYGALDPWGATAYEPTDATNSLYLNLGGGTHMTRLKNFPKDVRAAAMDSLKVWVDRAKRY